MIALGLDRQVLVRHHASQHLRSCGSSLSSDPWHFYFSLISLKNNGQNPLQFWVRWKKNLPKGSRMIGAPSFFPRNMGKIYFELPSFLPIFGGRNWSDFRSRWKKSHKRMGLYFGKHWSNEAGPFCMIIAPRKQGRLSGTSTPVLCSRKCHVFHTWWTFPLFIL